MSILASLAKAYERLDNVSPFGFSTENIGFLISLNDDGTPAGPPIDLRDVSGKRPTPRRLSVPASFKRPGITPKPFFLWDKTAFALGVSADPERDCEAGWLAFRTFHLEALQETADQGLLALRSFLEKWSPDDFDRLGWPADMKDQNLVFALESERRTKMIHEHPAAKALWATLSAEGDKSKVTCLVTGEQAPIALVHPSIKGVWGKGAMSSGASIVSFNLDAFGSYGRKQGENAPVSVAAAFAYTTALNKFLEAGSKNRIQIGDTSTVFWADASDADVAEEAEGVFAALFTDIDEVAQAQKIGVVLENI